MAGTTRQKLSEKGLLTPDNCTLAMIDLQPQMLFGTSNFDRQQIINLNSALAKAAREFGATAILIPADRGAAVREAARAQRIQLLNKPVKPAALRALLAQSRVHRVAAAE